jgi:hypothetical protein
MRAMDFIDSIVPSGGTYCIVGIRDKKLRLQKFTTTIEGAKELISESVKQGNNTYYGLASFKDASGRTQANTSEIKSFFIDIDCGDEEKFEKGVGYVHKSDGYSELQKFVDDTGFPRPLIVDSGGGWHAYWVLDTAISIDVWQPLADKFKKLCQARKLFIDPAVTADSARVLRVPNTINTSYGVKAAILDPENIPEQLALTQFVTPLLAACAEVGIKDLAVAALPDFLSGAVREMDESTKRLIGNTSTLFSEIAKKSLKGVGCAQIDFAIRNSATLDEPRWYAAITVVRKCDDRDVAMHKLSKNHPTYSAAGTEKKINQSEATYTCENYQDMWPATCEGCAHKGKINTPLALGRVVNFSETNEVVIEPPTTNTPDDVVTNVPAKTVNIPKIPFPFERGLHGGIYQHAKDAEGNDIVELVYEHDLFVTKRIRDPQDGEVLLFNLILPMDGLQEFLIPLKHIGSIDKLRDALGHHGVATTKKKMDSIMNYILISNRELQSRMRREQSRPQFGWYDQNKTFVIGNREYTANGVVTSVPSVQTMNLAKYMEPTGNLQEWKTVMEVFSRPGWEMHQLMALAGFGAPFMKFSSVRGLTLNLVTHDSGTGKTLIQEFINSIFGHSDYLMLLKGDTLASRNHRYGVMNNLCVCSDEMTNVTPEEVSDHVYGFSEGRGRNRMESGSNRERVNETFWATLHVTSSNASMSDKLTYKKATAAGELARIFEVNIVKPEELNPNFATGLSTILKHNYAIAGDIYMRTVVSDLPASLALFEGVKTKLNNKLGATSSERFWVAGLSAMLTGGYIARELGLINWDIDKLFELVVREAKSKRAEVVNAAIDFRGVLGEFLAEHKGSILQINGNNDERSGLPNAPIMSPNLKIIGRYEPDTSRLYIVRTVFKEYCVRRQIPFNTALIELKCEIRDKSDGRIKLMKGTGIDAPAVPVLIFEGSFDEIKGANADETAN